MNLLNHLDTFLVVLAAGFTVLTFLMSAATDMTSRFIVPSFLLSVLLFALAALFYSP